MFTLNRGTDSVAPHPRRTGIPGFLLVRFLCALHSVGPDRGAIHVPLGKPKTEPMVPVDSFVCNSSNAYASSALSTPSPLTAGCWHGAKASRR